MKGIEPPPVGSCQVPASDSSPQPRLSSAGRPQPAPRSVGYFTPRVDPATVRLAIDARYIGEEPSGIGQMALELLRGLADQGDDFFLKVLVNDQTYLPPELWERDNLLFCKAPWDPHGLANQLFLPGLLRRWRVKVLHSVDCFGPLAALGVAHLVNLHDVIPLVCRRQLARSRKVRWSFAWKAWLKLQCARASKVVTVSHYSASDIMRRLRLKADKVRVIHNPVRQWSAVEPVAELRRRLGLFGRVLLTVGRQEPHKNLLTLVRAMRRVLDVLDEPLLRLVVAGSPNALYPETQQEVRRLGLSGQVFFPGYLPEASLGALYQISDLFVFPSQYEGFGLPPVEAMQFGIPVVTGPRTALPEVLGNAACYVDTDDPHALADGILALLRDPVLARRYRAAGIERAARYSPDKAAVQYRALYEGLLRQASRGGEGVRGCCLAPPHHFTTSPPHPSGVTPRTMSNFAASSPTLESLILAKSMVTASRCLASRMPR